ncbi:MAG: class III lanthionine synthetase LanKC [Pseudonocardiales bacterium]|nr:class III lanthionine synthetase LanKC [Pseudonocardiales bacterium]MBV9031015.1 class III lanthionine synthetase LanKC [Pseudonocardiales bacterium]
MGDRGGQVDKRYEAYCLADRLFYDSTSRMREGNLGFEPTCGPVPQGWERSTQGDWLVHRPVGVPVPPQGWKVHVSACLDNADKVLITVWDHCVQHRIPFKFLRDRDALLLANAKYAHRGSSGKFVTIYPADEAQLEVVLNELGEALAGSQGPYILSDLRWGDGPLYVRYGAAARRYCVSETGALVLAMEGPDGRLVPDRREPIFRLPAWVSLPAFLEPHLAARNSVKVDSLPYRIERVLHFSNGGGLYAGRDVRTDAQVVLKEARPHAGLDVDGTDALTRLRREQEILERLSGLDVVPAVHGSFPVGEHHFLALEFIDSRPLQAAIVERYLVAHETDERTVAEYTSWALEIQAKVERAVAAVHERGVVIGDLHPSNVLLRPDDRVVLIDFEVAAPVEEGRRQTLANPGFAAPRGCTGFDIDRYALACLRLFLFLPLTMLFALDRAKANDFAAVISELFPVPGSFLDEAVTVITAGVPPRLGDTARRLDRMDPDRDSWESVRRSLAGAIVASATPERDDRLFPGDIAQFDTGGLNIAHGAAGVLYALAVTGAGRYPAYEEWLLRRAVHPAAGTTRWGFYDGLAGVAYVLDRFGYRAEALTVLDICRTEVDGKWERLGLDLHSGLAGIGCNLAHFADITGDTSLRDNAFQVADIVADRLGDENAVGDISGGAHPRAGLMHGCAGIALLFLRLYEQAGRPALLDLAQTALRQDLRRCIVRKDNGSMQVNEGWRTMPYLAEGSVGVGLVLDHYLTHRHDDQFTEATEAIRRAAQAPFYIQPGLFRGRAGMILYLSRGCPPGTAARDGTVAAQLRRLAWHAIDYQGHLAFPGEQLLRLSLDLATGNAGVLLALGAALHPEPVHLPFLAAPIGPGPNRAITSNHERR